MSKKKKSGAKSVVHSAAEVQRNALLRFERACELMIGPGHFEKFDNKRRAQLVENRLNVVKLKFKPGSLGEPDMLKCYQEIFSTRLANLSIPTIECAEMPVSLFLREGLGLVVFTGAMKDVGLPNLYSMAEQFAAYNTGDWLTKPVAEVVFLLHKMSIILSDWSRSIFIYSVKGLSAYDAKDSDNVVMADFKRPESYMVKFDGLIREVFRLGWTGVEGEVEYLKASPYALGFRSVKEEVEYDVYIQKHALQRLEERLGLTPGLVHHTVFELLKGKDLFFYRKGAARLVRFSLWEKKLGYLVCQLFEDKIVIRTFMFLTHDGTPEGEKLSELTQLQRLDKKYLGIDTLEGFLSFNIAADERLSALFAEAGCGGLLDLSEIKPYYIADVKERDTAKLLGYLLGKEDGVLMLD